jgi:tetratricopeptide (TPR) repeat protein
MLATFRSTHGNSPRFVTTCALLAAVIAGSALAIGSAHTASLCAVAVLATAAVAFACWPNSPLRARPAATAILAVGIGLTAFTAFQCIPLPGSWVEALAPANADVWARALRPLQEAGPRWVTISLDPVATRVQVLRGVVYLLTFVTALRIAARRKGPTFLAATIVATGAILAAAAIAHPLFGMRRVFGLYAPDAVVADRHIAPLVNPNHLAAYLNIALCLALAMALRARSLTARVALIGLAVFFGATQLWVASRGGVALLPIAAALVIGITVLRGKRSSLRGVVVLALPLIMAAAAVAVVVLTMSTSAAEELASSDFSKLDLVRCSFRLVPGHALFGVGRGAFESVFPSVQTRVGYWDYTHPENVVAQWVTEWGVPAALLAAAAIGYALRPRAMLQGAPFAVGAWVAIACTVVHNLADFSLEMPGVVITIVVCAAMVVSGPPDAHSSLAHRWAARPRAAGVALVTAGAIAIAVAAHGMGHELGEARRSLLASAVDPTIDAAAFDAAARVTVLEHPADPYLAFLGAVHATRTRGPDTVAWAGRALERSPIYGHAHFLIAHDLARRSPAQARLEYRIAMQQDSSLVDRATREGVRLVGDLRQARELLPATRYAGQVSERMIEMLRWRLPATSTALDQDLAARAPEDIPAMERAVKAVEEDLAQGTAAPWCDVDRKACAARGVALTERFAALAPRLCTPYVYRARLLIASGEARRALEQLRDAEGNVEGRSECLRALAHLARQANESEIAEIALERLSHSCTTDEECIENLIYVAQMQEGRGNIRLALLYYRRAAERAPMRTDVLAHVAALAARVGMPAEVMSARRALGRRGGADAGSAAEFAFPGMDGKPAP